MSTEHPYQIIESHTNWFYAVQAIDLGQTENYGRHNMDSESWNIRGVRFRFGYLIKPNVFGGIEHYAFHFSISCEPKSEVGSNWACPVKLSFWVFSRNEAGDEINYLTKEDIRAEFNNEGQIHNYTCHRLRIDDLLFHFPNCFIIRIEILVDPPSGILSCLPYNASVQFGCRSLAVNKELLRTYSDFFKDNFGADEHIFIMGDEDLHFDRIKTFQILYEILEHGSSTGLDDTSIMGVFQMAHRYKMFKVESACSSWMSSRKCKMPLPEKVIVFNSIDAHTSKWFAIKNTPKSETGGNPERYVRTLRSAKSLTYEQIDEMRTLARAEI